MGEFRVACCGRALTRWAVQVVLLCCAGLTAWAAPGDLDIGFLDNGSGAANGDVLALAVQADSKVILGGTFTAVNGLARNRLVRLNATGSLDATFLLNGLSGANNAVRVIVVQLDGKIVIGGDFTTVNGVARNGIARLNQDGSLDTGFLNGLSGVGGSVFALAVQPDGRAVIGGQFTTVNGVTRNSIARLNADGTLDANFLNGLSGANGNVFALVVQPDDKILAGGDFTNINGTAYSRIGRLNPDGTADTGFLNGLSGATGTVNALAAQPDGKILLSGQFTVVNNVARSRVARLNQDGALDAGFLNGLSGANNAVFALALQADGKVVIGGGFSIVNDTAHGRLARLNPDGTLDTGFLNGLSGANTTVQAIAVQPDGKIVIGGLFITVNGTSRNAVARLLAGFGINGRLAASNGASLAGVPVSLTGALSQAVVTDLNGLYAFPTLQTGGNYTVVPNSPAYVFTPNRADFTNLAADQVQNFTAPVNVVPPGLPPLADDFSGGNRDPERWSLGILTQPPGAFDPAVTVSQQTGQLVITPVANAAGLHFNGPNQAGLHFNGYVSVNSYDLSNGQAAVELVSPGAGGSQASFGMGADFQNFARFLTQTPMPNQPLLIEPVLNGHKLAPLEVTMTMLSFQVVFNGQVFLNVSIPYDPVQHRFRHFAPANQLIFETSPDASVWTERARADLGERTVQAVTVELGGGTGGSSGSPGPVIFDNLVTQVVNARFAAAAATANEADGQVTLTVQRTGLTNLTSSVEYFTLDGTAQQRSRYVTASGVLNFAAGETTKTIQVILIDNALVEGPQEFSVFLGPGFGMGVNGPGRVVVTIQDNDAPPITANPIDEARFFVRAQYFDFLSRLPDQGGEDFWTSQIVPFCAPTDAACINRRRVDVSNAFFFEQEYQQTGAFVYRLYRAAYGNQQPFPNPMGDNDAHPFCQANPNNCQLIRASHVPSYARFAADRARLDATQLAATQSSLATNFARRAEFVARYPASQTAEQFVDALLANIQAASGANLSGQRTALLTLYNATAGGQAAQRGAVLFRLAEDNAAGNPINNRAFIDAEYNRAFVTTQYFGYLRRDADLPGLNFWLGTVNQFPLRSAASQNGMVCAFITSAEYQQRFSLVFTRTNQICDSLPPQ